MQHITLYHNPRCSKSRQALALLQSQPVDVQVILYLKQPPTKAQLQHLLQLANCPVRDIMRNQDALYRQLELDNPALSDSELIDVLTEQPILLQRPIAHTADRAIVARPPETVMELLS